MDTNNEEYDFCGWATRNDILCADGRVIRRDAFKHNDNSIVPLVWNHQHNEPFNIIGKAKLVNKDEGVYAYGYCNDTEEGRYAKSLIQHGDITALSIYANHLKQNGHDVIHGDIREVSLVVAGANPGAYIESVLSHNDDDGEAACIYTDEEISLYHDDTKPSSESKEKTLEEVYATLNDEQKDAVAILVSMAIEDAANGNISDDDEGKEMSHADDDRTVGDVFNAMTKEQQAVVRFLIEAALAKRDGNELVVEDDDDVEHADKDDKDDRTVKDVYDNMTEEQKMVTDYLISLALEDEADDEDDNTDNSEENQDMKHNVFDNTADDDVLQHSEDEINAAVKDGKRYGSMRESFLAHSITNIDYLFPDAQTVTNVPEFISRTMTWVDEVMGSVHHTPFSRIKSIFADITADEARARGYIKGRQKLEEVISALRRSTDPQTVYKLQKMDRDDVLDITDFDVVAWIKGEMRVMLDEELARAILVGDGRLSTAEDKIQEAHIRPIWTDDEVYAHHEFLAHTSAATTDDIAKQFIRSAIKSRKYYRGSGNPVMYAGEDIVADCLLLEDEIGHRLYDSVEKLATTLRVSKIVTVPVMDGLTRQTKTSTAQGAPTETTNLLAIFVNLNDYNVGADKGGEVNMFDDFDIDYNKMKYLIETRCSGALIRPSSAMVFESYIPTSNTSNTDGE